MKHLARDGKQFDTHFEAEVWEHELDRRDQKNDANFDSVVAVLRNAGFPTSAKRLAAFKHRVKLGPKGVRMQGYDGATMSILDNERQQSRLGVRHLHEGDDNESRRVQQVDAHDLGDDHGEGLRARR